jgi:hypothetical protein
VVPPLECENGGQVYEHAHCDLPCPRRGGGGSPHGGKAHPGGQSRRSHRPAGLGWEPPLQVVQRHAAYRCRYVLALYLRAARGTGVGVIYRACAVSAQGHAVSLFPVMWALNSIVFEAFWRGIPCRVLVLLSPPTCVCVCV